ncbi:hypothetical protein B0H14DRAFT_2416758, partial [Mycena olivaceomarginata]
YPPLGRFAVRDLRQTVAVGLIKSVDIAIAVRSSRMGSTHLLLSVYSHPIVFRRYQQSVY